MLIGVIGAYSDTRNESFLVMFNLIEFIPIYIIFNLSSEVIGGRKEIDNHKMSSNVQ